MKNWIGALILGVAILGASWILGAYIYRVRVYNPKYINVTGLASKRFTSDIVKWSLDLEVKGDHKNPMEAYEKLGSMRENTIELFKENGIDNISFKTITSYDTYGERGAVTGFKLNQRVFVTSENIEEVEEMAFKLTSFSKRGIMVRNSSLEYFFRNLDELKKELLSDATENARERADEILSKTDLKVDELLQARAGIFQITEPFSTESSSYGYYETDTREKEIRVTVHTKFSAK